ncbi:hypothetical protein ASG54_23330 [Aureimonas sp. Leaf460]|nr:hypothetical protein ASG54_23330 [Aureimonas sp. Leaf460]KQT69584.1 hypothetical protein ASG62_00090 [Aureimonas sp. Leaf427]
MVGFGRVQGLPRLPLKQNEYVLTIDDGPRSDTTPFLLDILAERCVKATFFLVGKRAEARPRLVQQILEGGHTLGTHTYSHPDLSNLSSEAIEAEMLKGRDAVEAAAKVEGYSPSLRLFRYPGSSGVPPILPKPLIDMARSDGLTVAGIDYSPQDWRNSPPEESFKRLFDQWGDRGVILFHDGMANTLLLLPMVLDELQRRGAKIVALNP